MRHFVIVGILVIVGTLLTYFGLEQSHLMPLAASVQAIPIDWLWNLELITLSFLFALIVVPMSYSLIVFRRRKGETGDGVHMEGDMRLEAVWTIIPLFLVLFFAYLSAANLSEVRHADPGAMVIRVRALQWDWKFEYPEYGGFTSDELRLPVDRQIVLKMESSDVIHSFWVPEFRMKQDVVPSRVTEFRVTPNVLGDYKVRCAELCGTSHYSMEDAVLVVKPDEFEAWAKQQQADWESKIAAGGPEAGQLFVRKYGCLGCHSTDGSILVGPTWARLFGSEVTLSDGTVVVADADYIRHSILEPKSQVVEGFSPMTFNAQAVGMTDREIDDIIAYIATLK
ncbi:MAG TPA: cytochrome c oxidase subunit II [Anaerolineales bacterium]|jgi:cytochrome c oxidase subunit 2